MKIQYKDKMRCRKLEDFKVEEDEEEVDGDEFYQKSE